MGTKQIQTDRLTLRKLRPEDADSLYTLIGSNSICEQFTGFNPYRTPEMANDFVGEAIANYDDDRFYSWVIELDGQFCGTIAAYDYNADEDSIELGYTIVPEFWRRGYASEAADAVCKYVLDCEGISKIIAWVASDNIGSVRVLEKAGMKLVRLEQEEINGEMMSKSYYEMSR